MKEKYLVTTALDDINALDNDVLVLGPWCLIGKNSDKFFDSKNYSIVPSPWNPAINIKEAEDYCSQLYERILPQLSEMLNSIHEVTYPLKYWRILLGPWLLHFIGIFYDRYKRLEKAIEICPGFQTYVLPIEKCNPVSFDTRDFLAVKADEDYYNLKLFSLAAYDLCPNNIKIKDYNAEFKMNGPRNNWKIKLFFKLIKPLDYFSKDSIVMADMYPANFLDVILLKCKSGFKNFNYFDSAPLKRNDYSCQLRKNIELKGHSNRFELLLYKIIPQALPMCYIENYDFYQKTVHRKRGIESVKIVGSAVSWWFREKFKFFAAEAVSKGAKFIEFQHGGGFGFSLAIPSERLSLEKDVFYSWGWSLEGNSKIKPLPNPYLSGLKNNHLQRLDTVLLVSAFMPRYHYRFHSNLFPEDIAKYFLDKRLFLSKLNKDIRGRLLYRPYFYDYGWKEEISLKGVFPDIKFMPKGRLVDWMKKVKLVVIDHPHTSFLEALTINVPSIFYWDHSVCLMRDDAEEYFDSLRKAGILYKNPENAAEKVNEVCSDPMKWWLSRDIQQVRQDFCNRYAYTSKDWLSIWTKELRGLL